MAEVSANANVRGGHIDLDFVVMTRTAKMPSVALVRRRWAFPERIDDGVTIFDTADTVRRPFGYWRRTRRMRFVANNTIREGGLAQLELLLFFDSDVRTPVAARVRGFEPGAPEELIGPIVRFRRRTISAGRERVRLFDDRGLAGTLIWNNGSRVVSWQGRLLSFENIPFHALHEDVTSHTQEALGGVTTHRVTTQRAGRRGHTIQALIDEREDPDRGRWVRQFRIADRTPSNATDVEIASGAHHYRVFGSFIENTRSARDAWSTAAVATRRFGLSVDADRPTLDEQHRLYNLLPAVMRRLDEPRHSDAGQGQLRSFASVFGAGFDALRSLVEDLARRHDLSNADVASLPLLAHQIGWPLDRTREALTQRLDVGSATHVYRSVGEIANVKALINRATGRSVVAKEFVHNVAFTNAIEPRRRWEIWVQRRPPTGDWNAPETTPVEATRTFHGRPSLSLVGGNARIAWHMRDARGWLVREGQLPSAGGSGGIPATLAFRDFGDEVEPALVALPSISDRLLVSVVRRSATHADLLVRRLSSASSIESAWLTDHPGSDRWPTIAFDGTELRLFWQSDRSGTQAIWEMRLNPASDITATPPFDAAPPSRLSPDGVRDEMPACVADAATGAVWLVWSRDHGGRSHLHVQLWDGAAWQEATRITDGHHRDRAPAITFRNGRPFIVFQSNRPDARGIRRQRLWQTELGTGAPPAWTTPTIVADSYTAEAEPALVTESDGTVTLAWRTQRRATDVYTRTVDTSDADLLSRMGTEDDRVHYTWDTARENGDWYAGNVVGLFFEATEATRPTLQKEVERMKTFVEPFRPAHVRYIWHLPQRKRTHEQMRGTGELVRDRTMTWLHTYDDDHPDDRTVDTTADPLDLSRRLFDRDLYDIAFS